MRPSAVAALDRPAAARFQSSCLDSALRDFLHAVRPLKNARKREMPAVDRIRAYMDLLRRALANAEELYDATQEQEARRIERRNRAAAAAAAADPPAPAGAAAGAADAADANAV